MRVFLVALLLLSPVALRAQSRATPVTVSTDSATRRPAPLNYFARSLLIPGWGQAALGRKLTAGLFIGFEGLALGMAFKSNVELDYLDHTDTATARSRRGDRQDWFVLVAFNHLFSALEAYVSAHLLDFPSDLHLRVLPQGNGRTGLGVSIGGGPR